jgi:hypothetical protein
VAEFELPVIEPTTTVQIIINYDKQTGQCGVSGPVNNKQLMYGLLELAKDAVREFVAKSQDEKRVQPVSIIPTLPRGLA